MQRGFMELTGMPMEVALEKRMAMAQSQRIILGIITRTEII